MKEEIDTNIKPDNHKREITGAKLNTTLKEMVDELSEHTPKSLSELEGDTTHRTVTDEEKQTWEKSAAIFDEQQEYNDVQRLQALANVSNQDAGYDSSDPPVFTGKMGYVVLQPQKAGDVTTTFAAQIANKPNTIFEIRDTYTLQSNVSIDETINIGNNSMTVLKNGTWFIYNKVNPIQVTVSESETNKMTLTSYAYSNTDPTHFLIKEIDNDIALVIPGEIIDDDVTLYGAIKEKSEYEYSIGDTTDSIILGENKNTSYQVKTDNGLVTYNINCFCSQSIHLESGQKIKAVGCRILNTEYEAVSYTYKDGEISGITNEYTAQEDIDVIIARVVSSGSVTYNIMPCFEMPNNCVLKFNGGVIDGNANFIIKFNNTTIDSDNVCFKKNLRLYGIVKNTTIYTRWFEFVSADDEYTTTIVDDVKTATRNPNPTDNIKPIKQLQSLLNNNSKDVVFEANMFIQSTVYAETQGVTSGNYINNDTVVLYLKDVNARINLNGSTIKALRRACRKHSVICCKDSNVEIYNGKILGFAYGFDYPSVDDSQNYEQTYGINQEGGYVNIHDVEISFVCGDALRLGAGTTINTTSPLTYTRQIGNYDVSNCKIHDCGRNGISLKTSKVGHVSSTIIYNIGNGNADYISGPSNVYPRMPMAGIDIEFEDRKMIPLADRLSVEPVMLFKNLTIYDCGINTIASAYKTSDSDPGSQPTVKALTISNSELIGALQIGNTLGNVLCIGCHIKGGNQNFSGKDIQYTNCKIEIDAGVSHPVLAISGNFFNCNISDYSLNETYNLTLSNNSGRFVGCSLSLHNTNLGEGVFKNCSIKTTGDNIKYSTPIIDSCEVDGLVLYPTGDLGTRIIDFRNSTIKNVTNRSIDIVLKAEGCIFKDTTINNLREISLFGCVFDNLVITTLTSQYNRKIENCSGSIGQKNLYYCDIIGSNLIFNQVEQGWSPFGRFSHVNIVNSTINEAVEGGYVGSPEITGSQSKIVFKKASTGSKNMVFTRCILDSESDIAVTNEMSFAGVAKDCIFKTPIPTHGDSVTRPDASSMPNTYAGFTYFDETLGIPLYLKVDVDATDPDNPIYTKSWVKADGTALT